MVRLYVRYMVNIIIYLHTSHKEFKNRLVRRPIEDQSPFLERDLFESEMIIDPLD